MYKAHIQQWSQTIESKCPDTDFSSAFDAKSEIQNGMVSLGFGSTFGLILFGAKNNEYWCVTAKDVAWWKRLLTILAILVVCGVIMLPFIFIKTDTIGNIYVTMLLKSFLPTFGVGFFLFSGVCEHLLVKMEWLNICSDQDEEPFGGSVVNHSSRFKFNEDAYGGDRNSVNSLLKRESMMQGTNDSYDM